MAFACPKIMFNMNNKLPEVTKNLLIINVLVFLATEVMGTKGVDLTAILGLHFFKSSDFAPYQLFTYMFMHADLSHVFFNMFALYMFGRVLETVWGGKRFLVFYLVAGVGAALMQEVVGLLRYNAAVADMDPQAIAMVYQEGLGALNRNMNFMVPDMARLNLILNLPTVGASGAVYAILLGFGMLFPNERMFVFPLPFPIKAKFFVAGYAIIELFLGVYGSNDGIAHFAHLGGMVFGLLLILYWRKTHKIGGPYV